jgi:hypothetical protein
LLKYSLCGCICGTGAGQGDSHFYLYGSVSFDIDVKLVEICFVIAFGFLKLVVIRSG